MTPATVDALGQRAPLSVSVTILTYKRPEMLSANLAGLTGELGGEAEIIVIDNSPDDATERVVTKDYPDVRYHRNPKNLGVAGRNLGLASARGDIVVTLDDDVTGFGANDLARIRAVFAEDPLLGALCFQVVQPESGVVCNWCHHRDPDLYARQTFETYEISEGAVAYRRSAWERTDGYPEHFFISHEGKDLAFQLMNQGFAVRYDGSVQVVHHHHDSGRPDWRRYFFDTRNQYWLAARHLPVSMALPYLALGTASMGVYSVRDGFLVPFLLGLRDGLQGIPEHLRQRKVLRSEVVRKCQEIDRFAEGFWPLVRKRLFRKGVRI